MELSGTINISDVIIGKVWKQLCPSVLVLDYLESCRLSDVKDLIRDILPLPRRLRKGRCIER